MDKDKDELCLWCKKSMMYWGRMPEISLIDWKLKNPLHGHCAIEALIDRKIAESQERSGGDV